MLFLYVIIHYLILGNHIRYEYVIVDNICFQLFYLNYVE